MSVMTQERLLSVEDVAARLNVSEETVRRWLRLGRIRGLRPGGGKTVYRIPESELDRMLGHAS